MLRQTKPKTTLIRCKGCREKKEPYRKFSVVCSPDCAETWALELKAKEERKLAKAVRQEDKVRREKLKTKNDYKAELQTVINRYARLRDIHLGCVSCDKPSTWNGQWHASHFRSVGAASAIRFHLWNIHKSCSVCNNWKSGNLSEYEPRLREKIGNEKVDWLLAQNQVADYSIEYLIRFKKIMLRKIRRLESRIGQ